MTKIATKIAAFRYLELNGLSRVRRLYALFVCMLIISRQARGDRQDRMGDRCDDQSDRRQDRREDRRDRLS